MVEVVSVVPGESLASEEIQVLTETSVVEALVLPAALLVTTLSMIVMSHGLVVAAQ